MIRIASSASFSRALLSGAACLAALGALGAMSWLVFSAGREAANVQSAVASQAAQSETLRRLALQGAATKDERAALQALAIAAGKNASFISAVEALGRAAHAAASVSSVGAVAPAGDTPGSLTLSVRFSGTYAQCTRFIALVETMPIALSIGSLSLQHEEGSAWSGTLSLSALSFDTP